MKRDFSINAHDFRSHVDMPIRMTGNYGDNAMSGRSISEEIDESHVNELHSQLHKAGVTDDMIKRGAGLTKRGFEKMAALLGLSSEDVNGLLVTLRKKLTAQTGATLLGETKSPRYTWEHDGIGSVTIRDGKTGEEHFFGGSAGFSILTKIEGLIPGSPDEQVFLASHIDQLVESRDRGDGIEYEPEDQWHIDATRQRENGFMDEIKSNVGSFNFPWKLEGKHGTGTARFKGSGKEMNVEVVNIRDENGEEIRDVDLKSKLKKQAIDFIPDV